MDDAQARGDLAESLIPVAASLIGAVHEGGPVEVERVLSILAPENLPALAVVLAAMVDPDRPMSALLGWVTFDEHGAPPPAGDLSRQVAAVYGVRLPVRGDPKGWPSEVLRACHAAAVHYREVDWVDAGEREYHRRRVARKRGTRNANPG